MPETNVSPAHNYRKRPVVIQAFQMTRERRQDNSEWPEWLHEAWDKERGEPGSLFPEVEGSMYSRLAVGTLEGPLSVSWGDWIIRGIKGELYPCKPDVFAATYEPDFAGETQ